MSNLDNYVSDDWRDPTTVKDLRDRIHTLENLLREWRLTASLPADAYGTKILEETEAVLWPDTKQIFSKARHAG